MLSHITEYQVIIRPKHFCAVVLLQWSQPIMIPEMRVNSSYSCAKTFY